MIHPNFVIVGVIVSFIGGLSYLYGTVKGSTKPNRVTWFLWTLAPLIAFVAELDQGVGIQSLMTFMVGFNPLLIFLASFVNKKSQWQITRFDLLCGALSIVGIILWYLSKNSNIAIIFSILADGMAGVPTLVKSYKFPESESYYVYLGGAFSAVVTLFTIDNWNLAHFGFPLYILAICSILILLIKFKLGKLLGSQLTK